MNNSFHRERKLQTVLKRYAIREFRSNLATSIWHMAESLLPHERVKTATHSAGGGGGETQGAEMCEGRFC